MKVPRIFTVVFLLFLGISAMAQQKNAPEKPQQPESKTVEPLSSDEQLSLRAAEVSFYQAQQNMLQSPQYVQFQSAQSALQDVINGIYGKRKTNTSEFIMCDGPNGGPACAASPKGQLELVPVPKEAKK